MASSFVLGHARLFRHDEEEIKALLISVNCKKHQIFNRFEEIKHPTTCLEICQRHSYKQDRKHGTGRLPNDTTESSSGKTENFANLTQSQRKIELPSLIFLASE